MGWKINLLLLTILGLVIFGCVQQNNVSEKNFTNNPELNQVSNESVNDVEQRIDEFNINEVYLHNVETDCWVIVEGSVYDMTGFVEKEPSYVEYCGLEANKLIRQIDESWIYIGKLS